MKHALIGSLKALMVGSALLAGSQAFSEGSISKAEVVARVCKESKTICNILATLSLEKTGVARRTRQGGRVMPYTFDGRFKNADVVITIDNNEDDKLTISITEKVTTADEGFLTDDTPPTTVKPSR